MTAARLHLVIVEHDAPALPGLPEVSHDLADMLDGRPCDPHRFRAVYPGLWSAFLQAHFQSPTHVAAFFEIDSHASRNWWEGKTGPQGWAVEFAIRSLPQAAEHLMESQ